MKTITCYCLFKTAKYIFPGRLLLCKSLFHKATRHSILFFFAAIKEVCDVYNVQGKKK